MSSGTAGKQPVRITVFNQTFSLLVEGDPAELIDAAHRVDELMSGIAKSGNMDSTRVAILACLHLQDRLSALQKQLLEIHSTVQTRTRQMTELLDEVVEPES